MKWQTAAEEQIKPVFSTACNLFRRKLIPDLCCAVPEDRPVPAFLDGQAWAYAGILREGDVPPLGFDHAAAEIGAQLIGFHLFQMASSFVVRDPNRPAHHMVVVRSSSGIFPDQIDLEHRRTLVENLGFPQLRGDCLPRTIPEREPRTVPAH